MTTNVAVEKRGESGSEPTRLAREAACYRPFVDILETPEQLTVLADMPGLRPEDIEIQCEQGELTIRGSVVGRVSEDVRHLRREYGVGDFERTFRLSDLIDSDRITAQYKDGVLTINLPKVEAAKPRKIQVKGL